MSIYIYISLVVKPLPNGPAIPSNGREENFPIILPILCRSTPIPLPFAFSFAPPPPRFYRSLSRRQTYMSDRVRQRDLTADETHSATIDTFASRRTRWRGEGGGGIKSSALYIIISVKRLGLQVI